MIKRDYTDFVQDMVVTANKIISKTQNITLKQFESDDTLFLAIQRLFEILGEAANRIPKDLQGKYPDIPWGTMIGMRNIIIHIYDRIDMEMVWDAIKEDVPTVIKPLNVMLADLEKEEK
jgi:uncharacterized protein with HEPN domain